MYQANRPAIRRFPLLGAGHADSLPDFGEDFAVNLNGD